MFEMDSNSEILYHLKEIRKYAQFIKYNDIDVCKKMKKLDKLISNVSNEKFSRYLKGGDKI